MNIAARFVHNAAKPVASTHSHRAYGVSVEEEPIGSYRTRRTLTLLLTARRCSLKCVYCDLWRHNHIASTERGSIPTQIAAAIATHPELDLTTPTAIKLYNGGNFTDPRSIPSVDWQTIASQCQPFSRVVIENHATMCGDRLLRFRDLLMPPLEVAIGLETSNAEVLSRQQKRMTLDQFARASEFLRRHEIAMRCFVLLSLPYAEADRLVVDAVDAVRHAVQSGAVFVAIIPTRSHLASMQTLIAQGEFTPPTLTQLETALHDSLSDRCRTTSDCVITADTWDLETVVHCSSCQTKRIENIRHMNFSQQPQPLIVCNDCESDVVLA